MPATSPGAVSRAPMDASVDERRGRTVRVGRHRPPLLRLVLFYSAYVAGAGLGQSLPLIPGVTVMFWPPAGVFVATLLLTRRTAWPWYVLAGCLAELTANAAWFRNPLPLALVYFAANALEALAAAWLIGRFTRAPFRLESLREVTAFALLGGAVAPIVGATVIATTDVIIGKHPFATAWFLVWLGDGTGLLVSTPLALLAVQAWRGRAGVLGARVAEAVAVVLLLLGVGALSFVGRLPTAYLTMPVLLWAAVRFRLRGAAAGLALVTLMTAAFTALGESEFAGPPELLRERVVMLQVFLGISAVSALLVGALSEQYHRALADLKAANNRLETHVAERTASLRESEGRLRLFIENAPAAIAMFDRDMRYLAASRRWVTDYRLDGQGLIGRSHYEVFPELPSEWKDAHRRGLTGETLLCDGERFVRADGNVQWVRWEVLPWRAADGVVGGILIATEDVTARKEAEAAVRRSEAIYRRLAEANLIGVAFGTSRGEITFVNDEMLRMMGRSREDFEAGRINWAECVAPEVRGAIAREAERVLAEGQSSGYEAAFLRPDGGRTPYVAAAALVTPGEDLHVSIALDLTQVRATEEALRDADRRKDEFLATLAHELRNPLAPIRNAVHVLNCRGPEDPTLQTAYEMIERQVAHMVRLIDDLLDVSRITRGKLELRKERVTLAAVVEQAVEASAPHAASAGHDLSVSLPPEPVYLDADPVRLSQVLSNLLNNACKYTERGGRISLSARQDGSGVVIRVTDDGIGIAPEHLPGLFEMFSQVTAALDRSQGGLGIGLALVRGLVEMHGGTVSASSDGLGKGSAFTVRLPAAAAAPVPPPPETTNGPRAGAARRVLVVDDNWDSAESLAMLLRLTGHTVETAHDGAAAVEAAERFRPDVVLMDLGMPRLNGYEACRKIREAPWGRGVVMVAQTGWGAEADRQRTDEAGFDGHLVKPVDLVALGQFLIRQA